MASSTAHAQAYLRGIVGLELVVLPRCGHLPLAEQPEACVQAGHMVSGTPGA